MRAMTQRETPRPECWRGEHLLLVLLLFSAAALAVTSGHGQGNPMLTGVCAFVQLPALFLGLGRFFQNRVEQPKQALTLAAGFALLWAGQTVVLFWMEAVSRNAPLFSLWPKSGSPWLFFALAICIPLGVWLSANRPAVRWGVTGGALLLGCLVSCLPQMDKQPALLALLFLLPLYLLGGNLDWDALEARVDGKGKLLALAGLLALAAGLFLARNGLGKYVAVFNGTLADASLRFALLRLAQYVAALLLTVCLLVLMPRRRLPLLTALGRNWFAGWFWLAPVMALGVSVKWLSAGGSHGLLLRTVVGCVAVVLGSTRLLAWPVKMTLHLPGDLIHQQRREGRRLNQEKGLYWRAFFVAFLLVITVFASPFVANGYSTVWKPDGQNLYLTIMYYTRRYVVEAAKTLWATHQLVLPQWDFAIGQGASILSVFHINPLFLLAVVTPYRWMELVYNAVTVMQIPLAAWAFTVYCYSVEKREVLPVLTGAVLYACSGFVIFTAAKHIYFMTFFVIYLPLILAGCERWLRQRKWGTFVGMIFLAMIGGYYYAFVNTLLMAIYLVIRQIAVHKTQIGVMVKEILQLVGLYLWGFALSLVIFLPSVAGFFTSSRSDVSKSAFDLFYKASYYTKLVTRFVSSDPSGNYWTKLGLAGIAFTALVLLFLRWRERKLAPLRAGTLVLVMCLCVPLMGKIFNGFGYVTNRWSYGFAFCMALVVVCLLPRLVELKVWEQIVLAAVTAGYMALVIHLSGGWAKAPQTAMVLLAVVTLCAIGFTWLPNKKVGQSALALVTLCAVLFNINQFYSPSHSKELERYMTTRSVRASVVKSAEAAASHIKDDGFWRAEVEGNRCNRFCLTGGYGTMSYWSVLDGNLVNYYLDFDLNSVRQSYAVWGLDERASLCAASSVKYFVGKAADDDGKAKNYAPYGFEAVGKDGKFTIYQNRYALPVGYTYTGYMTRSDYDKLSPLEKQQALLQCAILPDDQAETVKEALTETKPKLSTQEVPWTLKEQKNAKMKDNAIVVKKAGGSVTLTFTGEADCETYVNFKNLEMTKSKRDDCTMTVSGNGVSKKTNLYREGSLYTFQRDGVTFNLGYSASGVKQCKITFDEQGTYTFDGLQVVCLPMADYVRDVTALSQVTMQDAQEKAGSVSGTVTLTDTRMLTLSIPWQKGWTVQVDGKTADAIRVNGMYTGVLLRPGTHTIEATYQIPGMKPGAVVSGVALVGGAAVVIWVKRRQKRGGARVRRGSDVPSEK